VRGLAETTDADAREALAAGDLRRAITLLMDSYGDELYRHVRLVVADADLADEVHQSVFVQAYRDLDRFEGRSSFRSWLYAIARHRCLDALKLRRRFLRRFRLGAPSPERADPRPGADERLATVSAGKALERCLAKLAPEVRIAVLLRCQEGLTYEEMSVISGEKPATLQARVARALPKLRDMLVAMGIEP
jgi:RNA polymerase sigma-70 factor (ECF subfamily)